MKNKIKYFVLYPLILLMVILIFTFNVNELISLGQRIPFGSSYWKDSLSDAISTNKSIKLGTGDSLYYNGVVVTSGTGGGGISGSDNTTFSGYNTFTNGTTFSDSIRANGYTIIDDAKITTALRVTGDVTTNLGFNKGSSTSIGTISTDSLAIITNNTKRIIINKNGYTNFTDTVQMSDYVQIIGNLNVGTNITALGKVTADSLLGIGYYVTDINAANIAFGKIDSARIPNTAKIDTSKFARLDTNTTEKFSMRGLFTDIITFATTVTFTVSPVFSALVNFANGINVTGNATVSGDLVLSGWTKNQSSNSELSYIKEKVFKFKAGAVNGTTNIAHGLDWHNIYEFGALIKDDTLNFSQQPGQYFTNGYYVRLESLNVVVVLSSTAYGLANDSGYAWVRYLDPNR
jgi:hypothetical protein